MRLTDLTAVRLPEGCRTGEFGPVEVTEQVLERARRIQPEVNAFVRLTEEDALARARQSQARWRRGEPAGLLDGVPVTVKDLLLRGHPTLRGSSALSGQGTWDEDAPPVARHRDDLVLRAAHALYEAGAVAPAATAVV